MRERVDDGALWIACLRQDTAQRSAKLIGGRRGADVAVGNGLQVLRSVRSGAIQKISTVGHKPIVGVRESRSPGGKLEDCRLPIQRNPST